MPSLLTHASYDEVPYDAGLSPRTHPQLAAVIAQLFGLNPARVDSARVLEIGCGTGANLLPMAYSLPDASFVGIDVSGAHISAAKQSAAALGLTNAAFVQCDVRDFHGNGPFDYIICHGVYSWVPDDVRAAILAACREALAPDGVAYISYNVLPGWHQRGAFREMLRFHARYFSDPQERIQQARAFGSFLSDATAQLAGASTLSAAFSVMVKDELELIQSHPDFYVQHEHLADDNHPMYFLDFVEQLAPHALAYLGDAVFSTMLTENLPEELRADLDAIAPTRELLEQYRDFITDRMFRQSFVVRADAPINTNLDPRNLDGLTARATVRVPEDGVWRVPQANGVDREVANPLTVGVLAALAQAFPGSLSFQQVLAAIEVDWRAEMPDDEQRERHLKSLLLSLYASDAVELRSWDPTFADAAGDRPRVFGPALLADPARGVPSPHHSLYAFDPVIEHLIPLLTGERSIDEVVDLVVSRIASGELKVEGLAADEVPDRALAAEIVSAALEQLRRAALLEAPAP